MTFIARLRRAPFRPLLVVLVLCMVLMPLATQLAAAHAQLDDIAGRGAHAHADHAAHEDHPDDNLGKLLHDFADALHCCGGFIVALSQPVLTHVTMECTAAPPAPPRRSAPQPPLRELIRPPARLPALV